MPPASLRGPLIGLLLVVVATLFAVPWVFAAQSLRDALRYGWPGPYALPVAELNAEEALFEICLAAGVAFVLLTAGLVVVGFAARTFGIRAAPVVIMGSVGAVGVASAIAVALTA